jgi:hypothetical protein
MEQMELITEKSNKNFQIYNKINKLINQKFNLMNSIPLNKVTLAPPATFAVHPN